MGLDHGLRRNVSAPSEEGVNWENKEARDAAWSAYGEWRDATEIITWRKENHIHAWFVHNVQNNVDQCEDAVVTKEQLIKFVGICEQLLASIELTPGDVDAGKIMRAGSHEWEQLYDIGHVLTPGSQELAEQLMPTQVGFFFGSTQYNEWYWKSLNEALRMLKPVLESMAEDDTVVYWSSW